MKASSQARFIRIACVILALTAVTALANWTGTARWGVVAASAHTAASKRAPTPENNFEVSGTVTYGNAATAPKYISDVTVLGTGSPDVQTTTYPQGVLGGQYTLTGFGWGSYSISLSKTNGVNGINSLDAARIAQNVTGTHYFTNDNQFVAADVTGNGVVSSQDAAKIAQWVVGLPSSPPNLIGTWKFFLPPGPTFPVGASAGNRTYFSVSNNVSGADYIGLLIGETTGNWNSYAARPLGPPERTTRENNSIGNILVDLPEIQASGQDIVIPVVAHGIADKQIISFEFDLRYDPSVIQPSAHPADVRRTVSRGLSVVANPNEPGLLRVAVYGAFPIEADGVLLNLHFTSVGAPGKASPITFDRIMFNEGESETRVTDGRVNLSDLRID
jgi:hypothetical protein